MSFARLRLILAAALFLGWIAWLGYAVSQKGRVAVISRGQLTAATHLVVAQVTLAPDGLPEPTVKITEVVRGSGVPAAGAEAEVLNLPAAMPPGVAAFPGPGEYLLPLVGDGKSFRVAGLPRAPGYERQSGAARPAIYPWNADAKAQLRDLGLLQ
ncbi:hypothetical protein [Fimbriiglobus ruber]|uniref:Uncharacterized protein n=1 Tax=Fimbriiglobus ruber TaxID=1908690 RepID=A0A225DHU3_9BACT|nr:hypothetical protein [Fimbriiglobus ruber]OWK35935.1 hypothetical protein FRUB_08498 [Fimbriiglobus ruber]